MAIEINGIPVPEGADTISAEALQAMVTALTEFPKRGSNANGEWVQFADGTQICFYMGDLIYLTRNVMERYWTFAKPFVGEPTILPLDLSRGAIEAAGKPGVSPTVTQFVWSGVLSQNPTQVRLLAYFSDDNLFDANSTMKVKATAIGRWK